jgi:hypothetical protein
MYTGTGYVNGQPNHEIIDRDLFSGCTCWDNGFFDRRNYYKKPSGALNIKSIKIPPGFNFSIYSNTDCTGLLNTFTSSNNNLSSYAFKSIKTRGPDCIETFQNNLFKYENNLSTYDITNNYLLVILIIIYFIYICKK